MGNQLTLPQKLQPEHLAEVPKFVLKENLGGGRFLKTLLCLHDDGGLVIVKVYYKRGDVPDLRAYETRLLDIREKLSVPGCVHALPFQAFLESDKAAYLIRPHVFADLYHRLSTRPFLSRIEKLWIAYQLLHALAFIDEKGLVHGDLKCENALVTSWNWVFLADFASYKPTCLPADNPADFSFFFDTGGRRRCYIAPERFYESSSSNPEQAAAQQLKPEMDIFSMGCVIAELFLEGKALFDLSKLLSYRRGEYDPVGDLTKAEPPMQHLILHMIQLQPGKRLSAKAYLEQWGPKLFPGYFSTFLHPFFTALRPMDADERVAAVLAAYPQLLLAMQPRQSSSPERSLADERSGKGPDQRQGSDREQSSGMQSNGSVSRAAAVDVPSANVAGATGLGTQLSSVAGPTLQADIMANVDALLADTQALLARLQEGESGAPDDETFFAADPTKSISLPRPLPEPQADPALPASASINLDEETTDEVYEFQCREEEGGPFVESMLGSLSSGHSTGRRAFMRRQDVALPPGKGWQWTGDWQVASDSGSCGAGGWQYRAPSGGFSSEARPANPTGQQGWDAQDSPTCSWRRRHWARHRRRRQSQGQELDPARMANANSSQQDNGMTLIAVLVCTLMRGTKLQEAKTRAVALLSRVAVMCDDDTRLQRVVPYILAMMQKGEAPASVQCAALRALGHVLGTIQSMPLSDAKIFNEYMLPALSLIPAEAEECVRVEYAGILAQLAATAHRFLMRLQGPAAQQQTHAIVRYEEQMAALRAAFTGVFQDLVVSARSTPFTRRAILPHLPKMASVLGRRLSNDFLLPTMITFLNDRDWQTRAAFFRDVPCMAAQAGFAGMEAFLLPCVEQALSDESVAVVTEAIRFLTSVVEAGHIRKRALLAISGRLVPKLQEHTSTAVLSAAAEFMAAAFRLLLPAEVYALLLPQLMPAFSHEPINMRDASCIGACFKNGTAAGSNGRSMTDPPRSASSSAPGTPPYGSSTAQSPRPSTSGSAKAGALLQQLPSAPVYKFTIDPKHLRPGVSRLTAALESLNATGQDGHIIARSDSKSYPRRSSMLEASISASSASLSAQQAAHAHAHATDVNRLVTHAKRLSKPTADMGAMSGRLGAGARTIQLSSESPLTFPMAGPGHGISDAIDAAIHTDLPAHPYSDLASSTAWQPRGILVAHLAEHKRAINRIAVAQSAAFFVTASDDETCKIWDSRRLEKDISFRSKLTYGSQGGKILACAACEDSQSVASASSNGTVHVWRVEYTSRSGGAPDRYTGIIGMRQASPGEGAVLEVTQWGSLLLYATQRGGIHAWDLRADANAWSIPCSPNQGLLERLAVDPSGPSWLMTGSSRGHLTLWDMRFQLAVNSAQLAQGHPIEAMSPALCPPARLGLQDSSLTIPLVYVASGPHEVGLWDVEQSKCHQVLRVLSRDGADAGRTELPYALRRPQRPAAPTMGALGLARHLAVSDVQAPMQRPAGCRTLLPTGAGPLLTGSSDGAVRLWDASRPEASYMVCGPPQIPAAEAAAALRLGAAQTGQVAPGVATVPVSYAYTHKMIQGVEVVEESCIPRSTESPERDILHSGLDRAAALCHQDGITHMTSVDSADRILLTASHDGVVKAWK